MKVWLECPDATRRTQKKVNRTITLGYGPFLFEREEHKLRFVGLQYNKKGSLIGCLFCYCLLVT